jgi:hypothetical protein
MGPNLEDMKPEKFLRHRGSRPEALPKGPRSERLPHERARLQPPAGQADAEEG